jgi:alanine dehydrogenase
MRVGVPKEIKTHEYRVGLTPGAVREYVAAGHSVLVETNAGAGIEATETIIGKLARRSWTRLGRCFPGARP